MKRFAIQDLLVWKDSPVRKPLLFQGARQVGKTWLLKEFGRTYFESLAYFNLDQDEVLRHIFDKDFSTRRILDSLQLYCGHPIHPEKTLVVLDEIQEAPRAVTSLKYFAEEAPRYHIASPGSYLGVATLTGTGFPVGKVDELTLHPMNFPEFLEAVDKSQLARLLRDRAWEDIQLFHETFVEYLRYYYVVGGMPEAVNSFARQRDFKKVRGIQQRLLQDFARDFGKHAPAGVIPRIHGVWNSLPAQLSRENKKFTLAVMKKSARLDDYYAAIQWLCASGLVSQVKRISKPGLPLAAYADEGAFKLFSLDVGLLAAQCRLEPRVILEGSRVFSEFKGAFTEQYVLQQLLAENAIVPYYWSNGKNEVDFLFQWNQGVVPLEAKAETNLRSRSLMGFCRKYEVPFAFRTAMTGRRRDWTDTIPAKTETENRDFKFLLENLPLYAISQLIPECELVEDT